MTSSRIEAYISIENLSRLEAIRVKLDYKGYSKIVDEIFNKYFENIMQKTTIDRRYEAEKEYLLNKIKNLEYELKNKEIKEDEKNQIKEDKNK